LVRSKRKKSVERGTEQRRWSIVAWRQDAGEAVEGIESGPEAGGGGAVECIVIESGPEAGGGGGAVECIVFQSTL
jgi:hypothetical protein